jgi:hypothetical protein
MIDELLPPVSCDEVFALVILLDRHMLTGKEWQQAVCKFRTRSVNEWPEWRESLQEKGYVRIVSIDDLLDLKLSTAVLHYAATETGTLVMEASLVVEVQHADVEFLRQHYREEEDRDRSEWD